MLCVRLIHSDEWGGLSVGRGRIHLFKIMLKIINGICYFNRYLIYNYGRNFLDTKICLRENHFFSLPFTIDHAMH